ncbi:hypothetical protein FA13DRAFT_1640163 [Coprinellus micaceus]|uniref:Uncharacterized protein n=1 Tax=Coprinellus micaceus TaxID=71717 RepID=A0A4Y7SN76_COPMI|nr:hypothetical protein FA13DRAFT_1640163 [Coprinellus micaceus]
MLHNSGNGQLGDRENERPLSGRQGDKGTGSGVLGRRNRNEGDEEEDNLSLGPRKRPSRQDPLVHYGRHFGRSIHVFCKPFPLITEGLGRTLQLQAGFVGGLEEFSEQERMEHQIFLKLMKLCPGLESRIQKVSEQELHYITDLLNKGSSSARSADTRALKSAVIDWITPPGGALSLPLSRNVKTDWGFFHYTTGRLLCPATLDWSDEDTRKGLRNGDIAVSGDSWPIFLYNDHVFNPENPWEGLLQGKLLVTAFKCIFTSPSSAEKEPRATRSGNAKLHGMKTVTVASIAYVSTLVRFALNSSAIFSRNDKSTDSERFYRSIMDFLESPSECEEVEGLIRWWNMYAFLICDENRGLTDIYPDRFSRPIAILLASQMLVAQFRPSWTS